MAAPNVKEHNEEAVAQIADLCDDENIVEALINAADSTEIAEYTERAGVKNEKPRPSDYTEKWTCAWKNSSSRRSKKMRSW